MNREKIFNTIALEQQKLNELNLIRKQVETANEGKVRFRIETKHWYGFSEPFLSKDKYKLNISKYTMQLILDEAINKTKERMNKLIDMQIEERKSEE